MSASLTRSEINAGWWNVNCCDGKYRGLNTAHCSVCHETFTSPSGFDIHRRYNKCVDPAEMLDKNKNPVFQPAGREYPCWSQPREDS